MGVRAKDPRFDAMQNMFKTLAHDELAECVARFASNMHVTMTIADSIKGIIRRPLGEASSVVLVVTTMLVQLAA